MRKSNGVEPLTELAWKNRPVDFYALIGIPRQFTSVLRTHLTPRTTDPNQRATFVPNGHIEPCGEVRPFLERGFALGDKLLVIEVQTATDRYVRVENCRISDQCMDSKEPAVRMADENAVTVDTKGNPISDRPRDIKPRPANCSPSFTYTCKR